MNPVVKILIGRDGLSQKEAENLEAMTQDEMLDGNPYEEALETLLTIAK